MIPSMSNVPNRQIQKDRQQIGGCQGLEESREQKVCLINRYGALSRGDEDVLEPDEGENKVLEQRDSVTRTP